MHFLRKFCCRVPTEVTKKVHLKPEQTKSRRTRSATLPANTCELCPAHYPKWRKYEFKHHVNVHLMEKSVTCSEYGWVCADHRQLKVHMKSRRVHKVPRNLNKRKRPARQNSRSKTKIMQSGHEYEPESDDASASSFESKTPFYCDHCHMIYTCRHKLMLHVVTAHSYEQPLSCPTCSCQFQAKQLLRFHVQEKHFGDSNGPAAPPPLSEADNSRDSKLQPC